MRRYFNTIQEMQSWYYNEGNFSGVLDELAKSAGPIKTTTTGALNTVFGAKLWTQLVNSMTTFGVLPKKSWEKGGYRVVTTAATTSKGGTSQGGSLGSVVIPDMKEITVTPKIVHIPYDMSSTQNALGKSQDDVVTWAEIMTEMQAEFLNMLNRALHTDNDTLASTNLESIDRICGSYSEIAGVGQNAGDLDIYSQDRDSAASWADAYVGHNSDTAQTLQLSYLDDLFTNVRPYWDAAMGNTNKAIITGFDTAERLQQLLQAQQRFTDVKGISVQTGIGGMQTLSGVEAGMNIATYQGVPMFPDAETQKDTLSRIYLLDLDHIWMSILLPVQHLESDDYQLLNKFAKEGVEHMEGELTCNKFKAQGKRRDLK